jgi:peptidoglycan hydrolase-like protein with peptidoglycan-binding domain
MAHPPARPAAPQTDAAPLAPEAPSQQPASATISPGYDMQDGLLRPNEEGIGVLGLQTALQRQGHALQADMRFGPDTEQALRSFQASNGLRVDGIAGPETFAALNQRSAPHMADGLMRQNDRGVGVLGTQTALRQLGHELNADSVFGPVTERAVRDFQQASGLAVDGTVGPNTSAALTAATRTMLSPDRAAALSPQAPGSSAVATSNATGNPLSLTPDQQRHLQLAREQLGPALTACGSSPELVERICAAAVSHTQQHADRGPVNAFFLSKDGERVAVVQQIAPMSEMNVAAAGQRSSEQHLAQAQQLAIDQQQTTQTRSHTAPAMAEHAR